MALPQSLVAGKLLDGVIHPRGQLPGIGFMLVIAAIWLGVVWGLVVLAALRRRSNMRLFILAFLALPNFWCLPILIGDASFSVTHPQPDKETGRGYFDGKADRELAVAIRACNPRLRSYGSVCDLDKISALSHTVDLFDNGLAGESQLTLALQNGPNPDVLGILLRAGKPKPETLQWVLSAVLDMRDLALLRAALEAGLDPNGLADSVNPVLFLTQSRGWTEGVAALLRHACRTPDDA